MEGAQGRQGPFVLLCPSRFLHFAQALWLTLSSPVVCFCQAEPLRSQPHCAAETWRWGAQVPVPRRRREPHLQR